MNFEAVALTNITGRDFTGHWDSKPYTIKAGETKHYPAFLAKHLAKHLAKRELGRNWRNKDKFNAFVETAITGIDLPVDESGEEDEVAAQIEEIEEKVKSVEEEVEPFAELHGEPSMDWLKEDLLEFAEQKEITVHAGLTKAEILERLE